MGDEFYAGSMSVPILTGRFLVQKIEKFLVATEIASWTITLGFLTGDAIDGQIVLAITNPTMAARFDVGQVYEAGLTEAA